MSPISEIRRNTPDDVRELVDRLKSFADEGKLEFLVVGYRTHDVDDDGRSSVAGLDADRTDKAIAMLARLQWALITDTMQNV